MTFPTKFARALVPVAIVAMAAPAAAADSADMAKLKAHISGVHTMTANFLRSCARAVAAVLCDSTARARSARSSRA